MTTAFYRTLYRAATRCEKCSCNKSQWLFSIVISIVSWTLTTMLARVALDICLFPTTSCVTSSNIANLLHRSEVHTFIAMFLLAAFKVISNAIIYNLISVFNTVFESISLRHILSLKS